MVNNQYIADTTEMICLSRHSETLVLCIIKVHNNNVSSLFSGGPDYYLGCCVVCPAAVLRVLQWTVLCPFWTLLGPSEPRYHSELLTQPQPALYLSHLGQAAFLFVKQKGYLNQPSQGLATLLLIDWKEQCPTA